MATKKRTKQTNDNVNDTTISTDDIFCENCDNMLDISRTQLIGADEVIASKNISAEKNVNYEELLKKVENKEKLSDEELTSIDIKELVNNDYYKKMNKKGEIKKRILEMIEDMKNSDENGQAYMICRNCGFTKPIKPQFKIFTKNPEGVTSAHDYVNEANYRNRLIMGTMPRTRNFKCPNKECPVYTKNASPEAIFFRKSSDTYETIYGCVNCATFKMN